MVKKPMRGVIGCAATLSILGCNVPKSAAIKVDLNRTNTTTTNAPNAPSDGGTPTVATGSTVVMNTPSGTSTSSQNSSAVASGTNLTPSPVQTVVAPTLVSTAAQELAQLVSQFDPRLTAYTSHQYTLSNVEKKYRIAFCS